MLKRKVVRAVRQGKVATGRDARKEGGAGEREKKVQARRVAQTRLLLI